MISSFIYNEVQRPKYPRLYTKISTPPHISARSFTSETSKLWAASQNPKFTIKLDFSFLILTPPKVKTFELQIPICQLFLHLFLPYNSEHFHEFVFLKNPKNRILRTIVLFHDEFLHDGFLWM